MMNQTSETPAETKIKRKPHLAVNFMYLKSCAKLYRKCIEHLFKETDPTSLAVFRISFGFLMALDIPHERELSIADKKWGDPKVCLFPLIHSLRPLPYNWMCILYLIMWLGAIGITLGYKFRKSCLAFILPYCYIVMLDKSVWNNHTYLFGLISILLLFTNANTCWSVDHLLQKSSTTVPFWNYFILRYQVFILYFMAGMKKFNYEWLSGYPMENLSHHWIFDPFKVFLSTKSIDYWVVHVNGFLLDSFAGFGLHFDRTRPMTMILLFMFHTMNSRLFNIGMFPYVGIVTMFIFCQTNWPRKLCCKLRLTMRENKLRENFETTVTNAATTFRKFIILICIVCYVLIQLFLPFSHFITRGYNGWTNGQYGYSWDMMVHAWDTSMTVVKVVDNDSGNTYYLNPEEWVLNDKWTKHADTVIQYAKCVQRNLEYINLKNISVYMDVWCSLNSRFYQRMFDPRTDLLKAKWSPFEDVPWVLPLLSELTEWRSKMKQIQEDIYATSNFSEVIFIADFPDLYLDNFVDKTLTNITLTVLQGRLRVVLENNQTYTLNVQNTIELPSNSFHQIYTISDTPSCYMYYYYNETISENNATAETPTSKSNIINDIYKRIQGINRSIYLISAAIVDLLKQYTK